MGGIPLCQGRNAAGITTKLLSANTSQTEIVATASSGHPPHVRLLPTLGARLEPASDPSSLKTNPGRIHRRYRLRLKSWQAAEDVTKKAYAPKMVQIGLSQVQV